MGGSLPDHPNDLERPPLYLEIFFYIFILSLLINLIKIDIDNCLQTDLWKNFQNQNNVTYANASVTLKA